MSHSEEIYNMKLHRIVNVNGIYDVLRVPGGWIYMFKDGSKYRVFVPYNDEFDFDSDAD